MLIMKGLWVLWRVIQGRLGYIEVGKVGGCKNIDTSLNTPLTKYHVRSPSNVSLVRV